MIECRTIRVAAAAFAGGAGTAPPLDGGRPCLNSVNPGIPVAAIPPGIYSNAASFAPGLVTGYRFERVEPLVGGAHDAVHEDMADGNSVRRRVGAQV